MRAVVILTLCLVLTGVASAQDLAGSQAEARALEQRWANCSQVLRGRLGALHPTDTEERYVFTISGSGPNHTMPFTAVYSPCVPMVLSGDDTTEGFVRLAFGVGPAKTYTTTTQNPIATFFMPTKKGEVARFVATYTDRDSKVTVVTQCSYDANTTITNGVVEQDSRGDYTITINNINACPRFPYTNKYMPPGGIAALTVFIVLIGLELLCAVWYHMTHTVSME